VCFLVEPGGIDRPMVVRITPSDAGPPAALSPVYDIRFTTDAGATLLVPATVFFSLDLVDARDVPSDSLLRLFTLEDGAWVALDDPRVDRVRGRVVGRVSHLSPFVVLRADRLADGTLPVADGGGPAVPVVVPPPFDAGSLRPDSGSPPPALDAGVRDAGAPDAGGADGGAPDAGVQDAGAPDAGSGDAGLPAPDAGQADGGSADAGDAG
jgi:hypothetical protein